MVGKFENGRWISNDVFVDEFRKVADSRIEGQQVPSNFVQYIRHADEKFAEFISLFLTNRPMLRWRTPGIYKHFMQQIKGDPALKGLIDIRPSNVDGVVETDDDVWMLDNSIPEDEDIISLRKDGKLVHYRVPIELATAVKNLHPQQLPTFFRIIFGVPTKILKAGAVGLNIDFFLPNITRDQVDAAFNAKNIPFVDFFIGLKHFLANDEIAKEYARRGGQMDALESGVVGKAAVSSEIVYGSESGKFLDPFYWKNNGIIRATVDLGLYAIKYPFKPILYLASMSEQSSRLGLFARNSKQGLDMAMYLARQASIDFQRFGYYGRAPNEVVPFLNASLQGIDRFARTWKDKPLRSLMYSALLFGIYMGFLGWNNRNKKYAQINSREKSNNWILMADEVSEKYWKIPKGHITKLIVNPFQMILEQSLGLTSKKSAWDIPKNILTNVSPIDQSNIMPVALKLFVEPLVNYDLYWNEIIEKPAMKQFPAGHRFDKRTSEIFKQIGKALNLSPIMMQHEFEGLTSGAGKNFLLLAEVVLGKAGVIPFPKIDVNRQTLIRRFRGRIEDWNSDLDYREKEIAKRIREIEIARRAGTRSLIKFYGYTKEDVKKAQKASIDELKTLNKKRHEVRAAKKGIAELK